MIWYIFGASFKQFSLSFPDVNKNKKVVETDPLNWPFRVKHQVSDHVDHVEDCIRHRKKDPGVCIYSIRTHITVPATRPTERQRPVGVRWTAHDLAYLVTWINVITVVNRSFRFVLWAVGRFIRWNKAVFNASFVRPIYVIYGTDLVLWNKERKKERKHTLT